MLRFRDLAEGARFRFAAEDKWAGMARGPWIKTGKRSYQHVCPLDRHTVGTINAEVVDLAPGEF